MSKLSLRVPAQMGRCETEHKEGKQQGETAAFVLSCAQGGCACSRGLQAFAREGERERDCPPARSPARPPSRTRALGLPFIDVRRGPRCTMGGCTNVLTCLAERSQSPKYMLSWLSERFWRGVHVMLWPSEERLSPVEVQLSGLSDPC
jgi:hypothetical protein